MSLHHALGHHDQHDMAMGNDTHEPVDLFAESKTISAWILVIVSGVLMCISIPSNFLVLLAFMRERKLRTYVNFFIINLCVSDLCVGTINMPLTVLESCMTLLGRGWPFGHIPCHFVKTVQHIFFSASIMTILIICNDRYQAIQHPLAHLQSRTTKGAMVRIAVAWGVASFVWLSFILLWGLIDGENAIPENFCTAIYNTNHYSTGVAIALALWIPYPTILVLYCRVYNKIYSISAKAEGKKRKSKMGITDCSSASNNECKTEISTSRIGAPQIEVPTIAVACVQLKFSCEQDGALIGQHTASVTEASTQDTKEQDARLVLYPKENGSGGESNDHHGEKKQGEIREKCYTIATLPKTPSSTSSPHHAQHLRRSGGVRVDHKKATLTLTLVVVSYAICWLPYGIIIPITSICTMHPGAFPPMPEYLNACVVAFAMVQSAINPFCYAAAQPAIRQTVWKILTCSNFSRSPQLGRKS